MADIQAALAARFAAPMPPEFHTRRIVFWQDEEREFEEMLEELAIPDVKVVKLTGKNNFAVKKLLLHDDVTSNFLVYTPFSYNDQEENWLRDIELYSETFRADRVSLEMQALGVAESPAMRRTMKTYRKFFANKERVAKLHRIGRAYQSPQALQTDIMAVLAGLSGGNVEDVLIAVLSAGLIDDENAPLAQITKFGDSDAFWQMVQETTGFVRTEGSTLADLAAHMLLSALAQTAPEEMLRGLERCVSQSRKVFCYGMVTAWHSRGDEAKLYDLCRTVEEALGLPARFAKLPLDMLVKSDVFPALDEAILSQLLADVAAQTMHPEQLQQAIDTRRTSAWASRFAAYHDALQAICAMQRLHETNAGGYHIVEPDRVWKLYTESAYEMDTYYRHFHVAFAKALRAGHETLEDALRQAAEVVEGLYQYGFLSPLCDCWSQAAAGDLAQLGYVPQLARQQNFYDHYVLPLTKKDTRAFVIISDALRYEVAVELATRLKQTTKGDTTLESMQSVFPSITKFGMAALLPGRTLDLAKDGTTVLRDGLPTRTATEREKVLRTVNEKSVAVTYTDLRTMKRADRHALAGGQEVVYIYHNTIDAMGDKPATEQKVFDACADAIDEIADCVRMITNDMQGSAILITADHGFLYTYNPLEERDKLGREEIAGEVIEQGRRYAIVQPGTQSNLLLSVHMEVTRDGAPLAGLTPRNTTRIKIPGGGANYVHGGVSLQEMVVPMLTFRNKRSSCKGYVAKTYAELSLLSEPRPITNMIFALEFLQKQPVSDKVLACEYTVYMTDDQGAVVSDEKRVIADRTSDDAQARTFKVRFNLRSGAYDKARTYYLVIKTGNELPQEIPFTIDIAFADDFGFDW